MRHLSLVVAAMPLLAATAFAQDTVPEVEPNNSSATATPLTIGRQACGAINVAADTDYYAITLAAARDVRVMTNPGRVDASGTPMAQIGDSYLEFYAPDGTTLLTSNDDFTGRGYYSQVTLGNLAAGTYFIKVRAFSSSATGSYTMDCYSTPPGDLIPISVLTPVAEGAEPNDPRVSGGVPTPSALFTRNSGNISVGGGSTSFTSPTADYDFYAFTVTVTGNHTISTLATPTVAPAPLVGDTVVFLVNSTNTVLAFNDDSGGLYSNLVFNITTPGNYFAVVKGYGTTHVGNYVMDITGPAGPVIVNATFTALVGGCLGSNGTPTLGVRLENVFNTDRPERPLIGTEFCVDISNMVPSGIAIRLLGTPIGPIDMTSIGAPGCFLEVFPLVTSAGAADPAGVHVWATTLPYDLSLRGVTVEMQAVTLDALANPAGLVFSNRGTAVLGNGY